MYGVLFYRREPGELTFAVRGPPLERESEDSVCLLLPFMALAVSLELFALVLAILGMVRPAPGAAVTANWFGIAAMVPLALLLSFELEDRYGPSPVGWVNLGLLAIAVLAVLLGTVGISAGTAQRRRWRNAGIALSVLWLFLAVFFVVQSINGARREREFYRPTPDGAQSAIEITVRRCAVPASSSSRTRLTAAASSGTVLVMAEERSMDPVRASSRSSTSSSRV